MVVWGQRGESDKRVGTECLLGAGNVQQPTVSQTGQQRKGNCKRDNGICSEGTTGNRHHGMLFSGYE